VGAAAPRRWPAGVHPSHRRGGSLVRPRLGAPMSTTVLSPRITPAAVPNRRWFGEGAICIVEVAGMRPVCSRPCRSCLPHRRCSRAGPAVGGSSSRAAARRLDHRFPVRPLRHRGRPLVRVGTQPRARPDRLPLGGHRERPRSPRRLPFQTFNHAGDDPACLSDNYVRVLLVDGGGDLWAGTVKGLDRFDPVSESFEHRLRGLGLNHSQARALAAG
jgi:hypothetical protein